MRARRLVARGDVLADERVAALDRARLRRLAQQRAHAAALALRRDGDERGAAVVEQRVADGRAVVLDEEGVALEVEARRGPVGLDVLQRVVRPPEVGDVAGHDQLEDGRGVGRAGGADLHRTGTVRRR